MATNNADFKVKKGLIVTEGITLGGHTFDDIDVGTEFVDTDDHLMSSGAIKEKIESYSYGTGDATLAGAQTFSGAKTFSAGITNAASYGPHTTGYLIMGASNDTLAITSNGAHNTHISTNSNTNSGNILIQQGANNPISITPNGTGDIQLNADTIRVGDNNADATITTRGTGDLTLSTNEGTNAGTILLADGANGDISITPNGTGQVNLGNFQFDVDQTVGSGQDNYVLTYDHANTQISLEAAAGGGISWSTAVDANIVPDTDNAYDIGSATNEFRHGYFDGTVNCDGINIAGDMIAGNSSLYIIGGGSQQSRANIFLPNNETNMKIQGSSTSNTDIILDTRYTSGTGQILLKTKGQTRFSIGASGEFKIGTSAGSSGQVLTSGGSGAIPTWEDAAGGISNVVEDASPQLGANLDTNSHNIVIDDAHGILDENSNEQLIFQTTANATSYLQVWNGISDSATGTLFGNDVISTDTVGTGRMTGPGLEATGSTTDVGMSFKTKGLGHFVFTNDDATSAAGPVINLLRNNLEGEVADDDIIGLIKFMGADDVMTEEGSLQSLHDYRDYAKIECNIVDQTNSTADGNLILSAMCADSHTDFLEIGTNKTNDTSAGVRAYTGSMVTYSGTGTTALSRDTHAGAYVRATGAGTFTLWDNPKVGDQVVVISDHAGTTTIDGYSSDTINGSSNTTITTQYNAKTFIATSTTTWIALG